MNYAAIRNHDIANGEGVRASLFVSGCTNHCPGCFNPEEQNFNYGEPFTLEANAKLTQMLRESIISGLSILGGDPLCQEPCDLYNLIQLCKYTHITLGKTVWLWTGFVWEDIMEDTSNNIAPIKQELLKSCDVVVDGPFVEALSNRALKWRGSANQRVIDVKKTLESGQITLYED